MSPYKSAKQRRYMHDTERAWAAGFFDGEGSVSHTFPKGRSPSPGISVCQVDRRPLDRFAEAVGLSQCVFGPYKKTQGRHQDQWQVTIRGHRRVQWVACVLWEFLSEPKREQFTRVLREHRDAVQIRQAA